MGDGPVLKNPTVGKQAQSVVGVMVGMHRMKSQFFEEHSLLQKSYDSTRAWKMDMCLPQSQGVCLVNSWHCGLGHTSGDRLPYIKSPFLLLVSLQP